MTDSPKRKLAAIMFTDMVGYTVMRQTRKIFESGSLIILILFIASIIGCERPADKTQQIAKLMQRYDELDRFSGSVLVAERGEVIYKAGKGYANLEWNIPNTPDTRFRIASITKQFTSMLVMQLVAEGKIELDANINKYLPEYPEKNGKVITIHHLLSHTSGMPHYAGIPGFFPKYSRNYYEPVEFIHLFQDLDRLFEPGERFSYSSFGYYLLGVILERVTGQSYEELLEERIFKPVGMMATHIDDHLTLENRRAAGYSRSFLGGYENTSFRDLSTAFSTGALFSTVEDLYLWDRSLYIDNLIDSSHKALLFKPNLSNYGYGWGITRLLPGDGLDSVTVTSHGGGTNGFISLIYRIVDDEHLIILLRNATGGANAGLRAIANNIRDILYNQPYELPKASAAVLVGAALKNGSIKTALGTYAEIKENNPEKYDFIESEFNSLGYELIGANRPADAIKIFKLNTAAFPGSANTFDSLGEAYLLISDRDQALLNYRKALEIDPDMSSALDAITRIEDEGN